MDEQPQQPRALDVAEPSAGDAVEVLDTIPGAHERAREGVAQAERRETIALDEL